MSIATLAQRQANLIRKAQDAVIFAAAEDAPLVEAITEGTTRELTTLPPEYTSLGHHTEDDGINWTREVESADVRSHGSQEPTRRDLVSDVTGLVVLAQESKMITMEMFHNVDLSNVAPDATTSEIGFNRASTPATRYYRLLAVASDGAGEDAIYFARFCPRVSISEFDEQPWTKADEVRWPLTFTAFVDPTAGYSMREMWGGPGIVDLLAGMGFSQGEVQQVALTGSPTGGTFTLTFSGQTTAGIAFDATASAMQSALEALSNIAPGDATVTGNAGGPWTVTFGGQYAGTDVPLMTGDATNLSGGTTPTVEVTNP